MSVKKWCAYFEHPKPPLNNAERRYLKMKRLTAYRPLKTIIRDNILNEINRRRGRDYRFIDLIGWSMDNGIFKTRDSSASVKRRQHIKTSGEKYDRHRRG